MWLSTTHSLNATHAACQNIPMFPDVLVYDEFQRLSVLCKLEYKDICMTAQDFFQFCQSDFQCPLLTQSRPFLAVLDEFNVGGWDPSTIHQPSLPWHYLIPPKLSSSGLLGALYNQTVITPSGLPASFNLTTICGKFDIAWHSTKYFLFLKCTGFALRVNRHH